MTDIVTMGWKIFQAIINFFCKAMGKSTNACSNIMINAVGRVFSIFDIPVDNSLLLFFHPQGQFFSYDGHYYGMRLTILDLF